ncbi:MAG: Rpn family recombination-promoting nuclease/putative transposase [Planctomycetota bacterium]
MKPTAVPTPHDSFAQAVFSDPAQAAVVFQAALPPELLRHLDLAQAELRPSLFKADDLHERRADFLFKVPLAGEDAYLLTLLEHQSRQDSTLAARLLVYAGRALDRHMRENPGAKRLPAVIPVVLYHGERAWTAPRELLELYALPDEATDALRGHVPNLRFFLDDLSQTEDADLRKRPGPVLARVALLAMRHAQELRRSKDPAATMRALASSLGDLLLQVQERTGRTVVVRYMLEIVELESDVGQEILLQAMPGRVKEDVVTAADQLRAQGRTEGKRGALLQLLREGFAPLPPEVEQRVASASESELVAWTGRVLRAKSLDDVFAG